MPDLSDLDSKYFVDTYKYNCPFCKRRHVSYSIVTYDEFDWTDEKKAYIYLVICHSCGQMSMHLSYHKVPLENADYSIIYQNARRSTRRFAVEDAQALDDLFFYSVPTSFFALDANIPRILRDLFTEAEGCLKSNFLTGASACERKIVYELAVLEGAEGDNYDDRIKSLKKRIPRVDPSYFDTLLTIQQVTSSKVHEEAWDGWSAAHVRLILANLHEILREIYVEPAVKEERRKKLLALRAEILPAKKEGD